MKVEILRGSASGVAVYGKLLTGGILDEYLFIILS